MEKLTEKSAALNPPQATIGVNAAIELRLQLVTNAENGRAVGIDMRLYRRLPHEHAGDGFSMTAAGFRVPLDAVRDVCAQLLALVKTAERAG